MLSQYFLCALCISAYQKGTTFTTIGMPVLVILVADHIALFDEAQRAWNIEQTSKFMRQKKNHGWLRRSFRGNNW